MRNGWKFGSATVSFGRNVRLSQLFIITNMNADKPFIFISCGQFSSREKSLGMQIKAKIEQLTSFDGYFAEDQRSVNGLVANILERLYNCSGFIAVMHPRGVVTDDAGATTVRASIWVEQEIAIAALVQQLVRKSQDEFPVAAYVHQSIKREGIRTLLHLNPVSFEKDDLILEDLSQRLPGWVPERTKALQNLRDERIQQQILSLSPEHIEALKILTLDGATSDAAVLHQLHLIGLARTHVSILEGLANASNLIQPVPGQVRDRVRRTFEMWEIKPEARQALERHFTQNEKKT